MNLELKNSMQNHGSHLAQHEAPSNKSALSKSEQATVGLSSCDTEELIPSANICQGLFGIGCVLARRVDWKISKLLSSFLRFFMIA